MEHDRSRRLVRIYRDALARDEGQRAAYVTDVCSGDEELRRDVESLLSGSPSDLLNALGKAVVDDIFNSDLLAVSSEEQEQVVSVPASGPASLPYWAQAVLCGAALRTLGALVLYLAADHPWPARQLPYPLYAVLALV